MTFEMTEIRSSRDRFVRIKRAIEMVRKRIETGALFDMPKMFVKLQNKTRNDRKLVAGNEYEFLGFLG